MNMNKTLLAISMSICVAVPAFAGDNDGTATAVFLRMQQGARATAMGGAFMAVSKDIEATWWNPAGVTDLGGAQVNAGYSTLIEDITNSYAAVALPVGTDKTDSIIGAINYVSLGSVDARDAAGTAISGVTPYNMAAAAGYAHSIGTNLSVGLLVKNIQQHLGSDTGTGFAFDGGVQFKLMPELTFGLALQNIGPKLDTAGYSNKLPTNIRGGVAYLYNERLLLSLDGEKPSDADAAIHVGTELKVSDTVYLRAGYNGSQSAGFTGGIGLLTPISVGSWNEVSRNSADHNVVRIDYAYVSTGNLDATHRLSLTLKM